MKRALWIGFLYTSLTAVQDGAGVTHGFKYWGTLNNPTEKLIFLNGFTNGLFMGPRPLARFEPLYDCITKTMSFDQAIAMIDKYYSGNPELWNAPMGHGIVSALTVKGGPCEGKDPREP
jgi:hypothetical protein